MEEAESAMPRRQGIGCAYYRWEGSGIFDLPGVDARDICKEGQDGEGDVITVHTFNIRWSLV